MYLQNIYNKRKKTGRAENISGLLMAIIPVVGFALFGFIPLVVAIAISFMFIPGRGDIANGTFNGIENFIEVLSDPMFWQSIGNTLIMALSLPICIVIALIIGYLLTKNIKGTKVFRSIYFIPYVCCAVSVTLMWELIFNQNHGILNSWLGLDRETAIPWLTNSDYYLGVMVLIGVWSGTAYGIVLYGAALTNVNSTLYEAAKVDGANSFQSFIHITLPAISPTTFFLLTTGIIGALQEFVRPQILGGGNGAGPNNDGLTMVFYLYRNAFTYDDSMGKAAATAFLLALLILVVTVINFKVSKKWVSYD